MFKSSFIKTLNTSKININFKISLFVGIFFISLLAIFGSSDLETRLTSIYSMDLKSRFHNFNNNENKFNFIKILGVPIYDLGIGLGVKMPLTSGLYKFNVFNILHMIIEPISIFILISIFIIISNYLFLQVIDKYIMKINILFKISIVTIVNYPICIYLFRNDFIDLLISYLLMMMYVSLTFKLKMIFEIKGKIPELLLVQLFLILSFFLFGYYGYLPIVFWYSIIFFLVHLKLFWKSIFGNLFFPTKFFYYKTSVLIFLLNLFSFLNDILKENNNYQKQSVVEITLQKDILYSLLTGRDYSFALLFLICLLNISILLYKTNIIIIKNFIIILFLLSISLKIDLIGPIYPTASWYFRDVIMIVTIFNFIFYAKNVGFSIKNFNSILFICLVILIGILGNFVNFYYDYTSKTSSTSWNSYRSISNTTNARILSSYINEGSRVFIYDKNLTRNFGNGLDGIWSYNDFRGLNFHILSVWAKMRDSSNLVNESKKFENRAFPKYCSKDLIEFLNSNFAILNVESDCDVSTDSYKEVKILNQYKIIKINRNFTYDVSPNIINQLAVHMNTCPLFELNCASWLSNLSIKVYSKINFICDKKSCYYEISARKYFNNYTLLPINYNENFTTGKNDNLYEISGFLAIRKNAPYAEKVRIYYIPDFWDKLKFMSSFLVFINSVFVLFNLKRKIANE